MIALDVDGGGGGKQRIGLVAARYPAEEFLLAGQPVQIQDRAPGVADPKRIRQVLPADIIQIVPTCMIHDADADHAVTIERARRPVGHHQFRSAGEFHPLAGNGRIGQESL